jgi:predicted nucleotidyltransferase
MESKEEKMLELFYNYPMKEWHFEEILKQAKITRSKAFGWLKTFCKQEIIKKIKPKGKMPFYIANYNNFQYENRKKLFALNKIYGSKIIKQILSNNKIKTAILFGSFTRSDWNINSDIDIFIYGNIKHNELIIGLDRNIDLFICKNKQELRKFSENLMHNIIKGNLIKGNIDFVKVEINA